MSWMKWTLLSAAAVVLAASCANPSGPATTAEPAFEGTSQYFLVASAITYSASTGINVSVLDSKDNYNGNSGATISVDGENIPYGSGNYNRSLSTVWAGGSKHTLKVKTPDGQSFTGTLVMPTGTLSGVTYSPSKGTLAAKYTVSPPASGTWPTGSYIAAIITIPAGNYGYSRQPTGTSAAVFDEAKFAQATSVEFTSCLSTTLTLAGYQSGSSFVVRGVSTAW